MTITEKCNFIHTNDADTADKLDNYGLMLFKKDKGTWIFINETTLLFDEKDIDLSKLLFTNMYTAS